MTRANYVIIRDEPFRPLVIRDVGPWNMFSTVTNVAETVVAELICAGKLPSGRRLLYYDSEGHLDEILVRDGLFDGFAPIDPKKNPFQ